MLSDNNDSCAFLLPAQTHSACAFRLIICGEQIQETLKRSLKENFTRLFWPVFPAHHNAVRVVLVILHFLHLLIAAAAFSEGVQADRSFLVSSHCRGWIAA